MGLFYRASGICVFTTSLNINKNKIASYGGSAGGGASIWLAFHPDMADAANADPIKHESTRLAAAGHLTSQCSYDPVQMGSLFTNINYFDLPDVTSSLINQFNLDSLNQLYTSDSIIAIRKDLDMLGWMSTDDPEFYTSNSNDNITPTTKSMANHHPFHSKALIDKAIQIGLPYVGYAPALGIMHPSGETLPQFMKRKLQ